jgi:hypothetical protein
VVLGFDEHLGLILVNRRVVADLEPQQPAPLVARPDALKLADARIGRGQSAENDLHLIEGTVLPVLPGFALDGLEVIMDDRDRKAGGLHRTEVRPVEQQVI